MDPLHSGMRLPDAGDFWLMTDKQTHKLTLLKPASRCLYKTVNFLQNPRKKHPIARPNRWVMGCLLVIQIRIYILQQWCFQYHVILDHVLTAPDCTSVAVCCNTVSLWILAIERPTACASGARYGVSIMSSKSDLCSKLPSAVQSWKSWVTQHTIHNFYENIEEVLYFCLRSSVKFQGHTGWKIIWILFEITRLVAAMKFFRFVLFKVNCQISRSNGKKFANFDPNWAFLDYNSSLNSLMAMKWCTKLDVVKKRCPIVFQGHPSNFKVTWNKKLPILTQIEFPGYNSNLNSQMALKWRTKLEVA